MKGSLEWMINWIPIMLLISLIFVVWIGTNALGTANDAIRLNTKFKGIQIASALNGMQGAPEGTMHFFDLPRLDEECISFRDNSVIVRSVGNVTVYLTELQVGNASISAPSEPINCKDNRRLILEKKVTTIDVRVG